MNRKYIIQMLLVFALVVIVVDCMPHRRARDVDLGIDLGNLFRMGLLTGKGGTKLGIDVLNGFVNVGVDRNSHLCLIHNDGEFVRPVKRNTVRDRIKNRVNSTRRGSTDVAVSVG